MLSTVRGACPQWLGQQLCRCEIHTAAIGLILADLQLSCAWGMILRLSYCDDGADRMKISVKEHGKKALFGKRLGSTMEEEKRETLGDERIYGRRRIDERSTQVTS